MSIATLKKKTQAKYHNMSVGSKHGFSLNGTHRSQGYVGQTSLSRSLPRTLMKGNVIRGHGGCCGKYPIYPIIQSAVTSQENINIVKPSVLNAQGMLDTKYRWVSRPYPYAVVKPDNNQNVNDQQDYITRLKKETIRDANACYLPQPVQTKWQTKCKTDGKLFTRTNYNQFYRTRTCTYTQPQDTIVAMTHKDYLEQLDDKCTKNDVVSVVKPTRQNPLIGN
jgi:hypothetical protein